MKSHAMMAAVGAVCAAGLCACTTNPATGEKTFTLQSWEWERSVALEAGPQFTQEFGGAVADAVASAYMDEVGKKLTAAALELAYTDIPPLDWSYTLLDSSVINAFALPGGKVYFSRGLAAHLENEAQMAGILGHEIGHVMARHGNQRISSTLVFQGAMLGAAIAVGTADSDSDFSRYGQYAVPALSVGGQVVLLKYGRDEESEADRLGMNYMAHVGYDPAAQRDVMAILLRESGGGAPPEWLSTHPHPETRIDRIDEWLRTDFQPPPGGYVVNAAEYQQNMLDRLARLPAPRHTGGTAGAIDLDHPATWCTICAARSLANK